MKRIMVATDGSPGGDCAVEMAAQLAAAFDSELRIVTVLEKSLSETQANEARRLGLSPQEAWDAAAEQVLINAERSARRFGASKPKVHACVGDPAEALLEYAKREQIEILVTGRRGHGRLAGLLLGSVSLKLASLAPCSVMIVPR
ncbi:MAG TPA: universal stress protein [Xanthobacteraceae bacterium]|jgi:nucleotide-binding universal stress UspA family protein